ncbi:MAG: CBS domain-containing protein [Pseudomonadota bacterium]
MVTSYRPPIRRDKMSKRTLSQTKATNQAGEASQVAALLSGKGSEVISIGPDDTLGRAVEVLRDHRIGALVVTDAAGSLIGILSERDIVRKLADTPGRTLPHQVKEVMTANVETCTPEESLVAVLRRMSAGRFRHLPVVEEGKLMGMITIGDVVNFRLAELEHETLQLKQLIVG